MIDPASQMLETAVRHGALWITILAPRIGQREVQVMAPKINEVIEGKHAGVSRLVLDCSALTFINSMGLGMCVDARNRAHANGMTSIAHGLSDDMLELLAVVKLDRLFTITKDDAELAHALGR
ncbi:MAG: STAS domain-containing protein [Planctomycetota bacterium]